MKAKKLGSWDGFDNPGWNDYDPAGWGLDAPRRRFPWRAVLIVLIVGVVGVGGLVAARAAEGPEGAARRYLRAVVAFDGNEVARRTCAAQQQALQESGLLLTAIYALADYYLGIGADDFAFDVQDVSVTTLSRSDGRAIVGVRGVARVSFLMFSVPAPIDEAWIMVREGGRWKWCGHARPPNSPHR